MDKYTNLIKGYTEHSKGLWIDRYDMRTIFPWFVNIYRNNYIFDFLKKDKAIKSKKVLDFGCGYGDVCFKISPLVSEVVGLDIVPNMITKANKYKIDNNFINTNFKLIENRAPYPDEYFDYILLPDVIEHFVPEDRDFYVNELKRILKNNGKIIVITPSITTMKVLEFIDTLLLKLVFRKQVIVVKNPKNFFFSKKELISLFNSNGMKEDLYTKICFYPAPERSGFFGVLEQGFMRIGLQKLFFNLFYMIFKLISVLTIFNQKMFLVVSKK